jgi:hypothetical protein
LKTTRSRTIVLVATVAALVLGAGAARAQVFYQYPGAPVVTDAEPAAGALFGVGENSLLRFLGFGRFNISNNFDLGLELVVDNQEVYVDSDWRVGLGADVKYSIRPTSVDLPFDLAALAGFGFESGGDFTNLNFPVAGVISHSLSLKNGREVVPFGGVYVIVWHGSYSPSGLGSYSDTDVDAEMRVGSSIELWDSGDAFFVVHIADQFLFTVGFNARM